MIFKSCQLLELFGKEISMTELDEIVEGFKLNIDRISPERLAEIVTLLDAVPRARLNEILDKIEAEIIHDSGEDDMVGAVEGFSRRVREEIQKTL